MSERPICPTCNKRIDRFQRAAPKPSESGVYASYPCTCWHPAEQAMAMVAAWRRSAA